MRTNLKRAALILPLLLGACAVVPSGPSAMALPGTGKNFDQFRADDMNCRQYAKAQLGGVTAREAADESMVRSATVGTVLGAAVGAAAGGSRGAGVGAATGMVMGTAAGADESRYSAYEAQRRYDHAYLQCMYAKGHRVPVSGHFVTEPGQGYTTDSAPLLYPPPPPPGYRYPGMR